jgi:hypothetical protein
MHVKCLSAMLVAYLFAFTFRLSPSALRWFCGLNKPLVPVFDRRLHKGMIISRGNRIAGNEIIPRNNLLTTNRGMVFNFGLRLLTACTGTAKPFL